MPSDHYKPNLLGQEVIQNIAVCHPPGCRDTDKPYVFGGENERGVLNNIECFDPEAGAWSVAGQMQVGRRGPAVAVLEGRAYICGGGTDRSGEVLESVACFDPRAIERAKREAEEERQRVIQEEEKAAANLLR